MVERLGCRGLKGLGLKESILEVRKIRTTIPLHSLNGYTSYTP